MCVCMYIYIYMYTHMYVCVHIFTCAECKDGRTKKVANDRLKPLERYNKI